MSKIICYWSGTGNTEAIANKIKDDLGCEAVSVAGISAADASKFDLIILGCPSMGSEELESDEFEPFYKELMNLAKGKKFALFGSYGWGDGEWMRNWQEDLKSLGGNLVCEGLIVNGDDSAIDLNSYNAFISALK
ncbi:MAG: flavodoxin domain-containing protein [bacterium]|jgi:flavodoxin short chain|nr:flavodoxin domain-containing protein [bacterium]